MTDAKSKPLTQEEVAAKRFAEEIIPDHGMEILLDEGLYRHVRFKRPDSLNYYFDLVTWPGFLAINGDLISGYTFSRLQDMFVFFAGDNINPMYWEEKITCPKIETRVHDMDAYDPMTMDEPPWTWDWSFLYSCHAIQWGIGRYTEEKEHG